MDTSRQSVEMLTAHRDSAENYFKVGMIPKNDLLHAEVELANGKQALVRAKNAVELAKSSFNTVLNRKIFASVEVVDILAYHPLNQSFEDCLNVAQQARLRQRATITEVRAGLLAGRSRDVDDPATSLLEERQRAADGAHGGDAEVETGHVVTTRR